MEDTNPEEQPIDPTLDPEFKDEVRKFLDSFKSKPASSKHPYYCEKYGKVARNIIDSVVKTKSNYILKLHGGNPVTARIQWYQGLKYLKDHMDPSAIYNNLSHAVGCRFTDEQLEFYVKRIYNKIDIAAAPLHESKAWKQELLDWLDTPDKPLNSKFPAPSPVVLTDEDIAWANQQMLGFESLYLFRFTTNEILVIRYDNAG